MESPISASLGAMGSLLRKLDMLLGPSEALLQLHKGAKRWTHLLKDNLEEISSYLQDLSEVEDPPLTAKCWMKEVRELSYDIENYIDSFVLPGHVANIKTRSGRRRRCRRGCRRIRLRHIKITRLLETTKKLNRRKRVAARISDFRIDAREALERHKRYELHCCSGIRPVLLPAAGRLPTTWEEGAGIIIDDRMRKFMDSIAEDKDPQLKVVSVIGSEGIGKTTLVKVLYHKLKGQFDCRAFIRLTRKPDIKTALRDILTQVQQQQQPHNHCEDPDLLSKIREYLQYKRYLIVIDDLWSASLWDVISYAFPGGRMCSRIIMSTQIEDIALACCSFHSEYVFRMTPLDGDLSRELFLSRLFFPERDFPQKLKEVLNKIVKICSGLPLATTVIASLLATHPVILMEQWTYIYDSLISKLRTSSSASEGMKLVVNFSYNNLTSHLKTCLLYLSMYPEGHTVCKDDLVKQWVAEGFIDGTEGKEVETAENYFHELIGRRFLQPECIKYTSEIASCSVHEVVRDLITQKSLEENFVVVLDHYRRNVSLSEKVHRLSLHFPHTKYAMKNIRLSQVWSLSCFGLSKCMPSIREFKLLRVLNLNLSGYDDDDEDIIDLTWISELLRLRYLKVASDVCIELPKHMGDLQYLETVDISKKITDVPSDIIHLPRLLHLHLPFETNLMDWLGPAASLWSFGKPTDLQYLYLTCFIPVPDHLQRNILIILGSLFRGLGSLKTLAFILSSAHQHAVAHGPSEETVTWDWDDFAPPLLERFEWLLHSCSFSRVPKWIGKLGNLCILKISVRELMRDDVNILGELPALTTLSLYVKIVPVERIDKAGFSVLKYFKFKCSTLPRLKFEADAMPNLQKLKLGFSAHSHRVDQQSTVPISIEHLPSLKEISAKVADASSDAESALTAAISNHPRNPRIRMQLVDWNSYGPGVWYTVSKQENPLALEEHEIPDPEEGLDDHCVSQYKDSRDDQNKEAYVRAFQFQPPIVSALNEPTKLHISNLNYGVSNEDIKELFSNFGDIEHCSINYDRSGRSKGTAEVFFSRRSDALAAIKRYNNVKLDGKPMQIEIIGTNIEAPPPPPSATFSFNQPALNFNFPLKRAFQFQPPMVSALNEPTKLHISNLNYGVSNEDIKELFSNFGDIEHCSINYDRSGRSKGTAEVFFSRRSHALAAIKRYNNVKLDGKPMQIEIIGTNIEAPPPPPATFSFNQPALNFNFPLKRYDGRKRRRKENNTKNLESPDASTSPSIIEGSVQNNWAFEHFTASSSYASKATYASPPPNISDKGKSYASSTPDILSTTSAISCTPEATNPQQRDSKIERCQTEGCRKIARRQSWRCITHGGGRRCQKDGCQKGVEGKAIFCKAHGGGKRCKHLGCIKSAEGRTDFCIAHSGGRRCSYEGCKRVARGKSGLCIKHGGGKRCQMVNCFRSAVGGSGLCTSHGGGRRCWYPYCTNGAQESTWFCKVHGGGKRCTSLGCTEAADGSTEFCKGHGGGKLCAFQGGGMCTNSVRGGTQFCVAHGGGKRCAVPSCPNSARGRTDYCVAHGGGKRCQFEGCGMSVQGSTDLCEAHGGGKHSWRQLYPFSRAGAQQGDRPTRSKTGLCSAESTSSTQNSSASDGGTSGSAITALFATVKPNEMKIAENMGDPPRVKSNNDKSGILVRRSVLVRQPRTKVREDSVLSPVSEGRVHGASSMDSWTKE